MLQCLGWSIFELVVIATAAGALSNRLFGFHAVWFWKLVFGGVALGLALLGPIGFVRRFVRKIAVWAVAASIVYLTWWILAHGHLHKIWNQPGHHGSFWLGVDLVIALTVSWIPLVADYTRFSTTRRAAFWGAGVGYLLPTLYQFGFGAILVSVAVAATGIALVLDLTRYQQFLLLLGAFFVPLFGVLLADWLRNGLHYTREDVFDAPAFRPGMVLAWLAGFMLYEWIAQTQALGFWTRFLAHLHPPGGGIGASLPGFAAAFGLALALVFGELERLVAGRLVAVRD